MTSFVAFLRGINVGGRKVLMQDLQQVFENMEFSPVKTLIASGNVLFNSSENEEKLRGLIEKALEKRFRFSIPIILRTKEELQKLVERKPFDGIACSTEKRVRLQVTLFNNPVIGDFPMQRNGFTILSLGQRELGSVVYPEGKTTELMTYIDKTFGKDSTTRNWHTLQKLVTM